VEKQEFLKDLEEARELYPFIEYEYLSNKLFPHKITDDFEITDHEGNHWGTFRASVYFSYLYPRGFAILQDVSKAFPWEIDWHTSEEGQCCVCSPIESIEMKTKELSILCFINRYIIPFYSNQIYKREFDEYKNGNYSHDHEGIWEALEEELSTRDRKKIKQIVDYIRTKPGRNDICYCGSGKKLKKCHLDRIAYIKDASKCIVN
jgi:SEC-C motif-containing protein